MRYAVDARGSLVVTMSGLEADALRRRMKHWAASHDPDLVSGQLFQILDSDLSLSYGLDDRPASGITSQEAQHVLAHFGAGGYAAGDFTRGLLGIICRADPGNKARLAGGFPGYVLAAHLAQNGGLDLLREIASRP